MGDVIYGSPFVVSDGADVVTLVAVATRGGKLLLVDAKGEILGSADMAGEAFG